ncbi:16S rRNA (cytosine(967)-C(5))-methyltransferase [candidate division LCP-89 bacterium B3_LCP]|uniref:16S rRNA (cytosine(967)-C(5))-methyltransferase n=1 Tax=candidate division LCP-89 bacterium B3_LCP TaxID=2012998 RepID=A0A532V3H9_UNCL8|nr:MAG: 16S rRNA (cytosine(967)-C(5))-methyltransferase [candidate division LCP-89 bacterium B3_LCP]
MYTEQIISRIMKHWEDSTNTVDFLLSRELDKSTLSAADKARITDGIYNWVRCRGSARYLLNAALRKGINSIPPKLRRQLELAVCRMLFDDRVPKPIIVSSAIEAIKRDQGAKLVSTANAVLRRISDDPPPWPDADNNPVDFLAASYSHPDWIVDRWLKRWGNERTIRQLAWDNERPYIWLRYNRLKLELEAAKLTLQTAGIDFDTFPDHTGYFKLKSGFYPDAAALVKAGYFTVQDPSASLSVRLLNPKKDWKILDMCAAPGGKTTHIAEVTNAESEILAVDSSGDRLKMLKKSLKRLNIKGVRTLEADCTKLSNFIGESTFDAVLIDVPCSGLGVLSRRADLRWRRKQADLGDLTNLQRMLIRAGAEVLRPGGFLVYSTCSIEPEENEDIVDDFLKDFKDFHITDNKTDIPKNYFPSPGQMCTFSPDHKIDGIYAVKLTRG